MARLKNFKVWFKYLKTIGVKMYGKDQSDLDWYVKYNNMNCLIWAFYNSNTHFTDGTYFKK
jgi:hypothetical protein